MAFPGTYNINYYRGDTFEFRVYPKDSVGNQFSLVDFTQFRFTITNVLGEQVAGGPVKVTINAFASEKNNQYILCAITPENGALLQAGQTYFYDVEIGRISTPYDFVYTLLQGTITVSEQVTLPFAVPNPPQNVLVSFTSSTSGTVTWSPPSGTAPAEIYNVYLVSPNLLPNPVKLNQTRIPSTATSFSATLPAGVSLPPGTPITIGVAAENVSGQSTLATANAIIPSGA
jgi:hypothetical protein